MNNVAVLTSGGVDSSVALYLLKKQGFTPTAFYIKVWLEDDLSSCPWREDIRYVTAITGKLGVQLKIVNLQKEYWEYIIQYALKTLKQGKTPNPDVFCNTLIKFGVFVEKYGQEFDYVATGHYARLKRTHIQNSRVAKKKFHKQDSTKVKIRLLRAKDKQKDQTYFLGQLALKQLQKVLFPIGNLLKSDVRSLARKAGLVTYDRPDSQGLCFLGKINFRTFLQKYIGEKDGSIIDIDTGRRVGAHRGFWFYTIGQREGLQMGGIDRPYYVCRKDPQENILYVAKGHDHKALYHQNIVLRGFNVLADDLLEEGRGYLVKLRHPHKGVYGRVTSRGKDSIGIQLDKKEFAVTEGQFGCLYDGDVVVGQGELVGQEKSAYR